MTCVRGARGVVIPRTRIGRRRRTVGLLRPGRPELGELVIRMCTARGPTTVGPSDLAITGALRVPGCPVFKVMPAVKVIPKDVSGHGVRALVVNRNVAVAVVPAGTSKSQLRAL